jgi:hypothetical protein
VAFPFLKDNTMNAIVNMTDATITRGQRAWGKIKATAAEQRDLWRYVGEALLVGRRENPSNQAFGKWCKEMGFDDIPSGDRSDAMWFASYPAGNTIPAGMTHPKHVRQWDRENQQTSSLPEELQEITVETKKVPTMDDRTAEKVSKLARRAESNDEGSEIAKKHLEALAKKHEVSADDLKEAASIQAPTSFYQFTPTQLGLLEEIEGNVHATVAQMERSGLTREAIAKVFINIAQQILQGEQK